MAVSTLPPMNPITQPESVLWFVQKESAPELGSPNVNASGDSEVQKCTNLFVPGGPANALLFNDFDREAKLSTNGLQELKFSNVGHHSGAEKPEVDNDVPVTHDSVASPNNKDIGIVDPINISISDAHDAGKVVESAGASIGHVLHYLDDGGTKETDAASEPKSSTEDDQRETSATEVDANLHETVHGGSTPNNYDMDVGSLNKTCIDAVKNPGKDGESALESNFQLANALDAERNKESEPLSVAECTVGDDHDDCPKLEIDNHVRV